MNDEVPFSFERKNRSFLEYLQEEIIKLEAKSQNNKDGERLAEAWSRPVICRLGAMKLCRFDCRPNPPATLKSYNCPERAPRS